MKSKTMESHKKKVPLNISCGVITLSDSLSKDKDGKNKDLSGKYLIETLNEKYSVNSYFIIPDKKEKLELAIQEMVKKDINVIFTTGGTGLESRDISIETLMPLFEKTIHGFGEIFRAKSYEELGSGALLSRASAGIYKKTIIFALPGSPNAVKMGLAIVINELGHLVKHSSK